MPNDRIHDFLVFIGRFQPFHIGHKAVIDRALERATTVIVLVGSANAAPSAKNPFTFEQRTDMLHRLYRHEISVQRLVILPLDDHPSDERWAADVRTKVRAAVAPRAQVELSVALTGFLKDATSVYLNWFPEWSHDFLEEQIAGVFNATDIRDEFFRPLPRLPGFISPPEIEQWLQKFTASNQFAYLVEEKKAIDHYHKIWENAPYPPIFVTVDAVVEQNKNVLLIRRGQAPGKGLLALPGGFVNQYEVIRRAAARELWEETSISDSRGRIPQGRLLDYMREDRTKVFDSPDRDLRGRMITFAHYFSLPDGPQFSVKGADDAAEAAWYPIGPDLKPTDFYADHFSILAHYFGL